jgi:hypothetical protein
VKTDFPKAVQTLSQQSYDTTGGRCTGFPGVNFNTFTSGSSGVSDSSQWGVADAGRRR